MTNNKTNKRKVNRRKRPNLSHAHKWAPPNERAEDVPGSRGVCAAWVWITKRKQTTLGQTRRNRRATNTSLRSRPETRRRRRASGKWPRRRQSGEKSKLIPSEVSPHTCGDGYHQKTKRGRTKARSRGNEVPSGAPRAGPGVATAAVGNGVDGPRRLRAGTAARGGGPPGSRQHRSQEPRCGRNLNVRRQTSKET